MKIAIVYKWARNSSDALVSNDGSIDWRNAKMVPGEDDPTALHIAKELAEQSGGELIGLTIGDGDASWALARGVPQTLSVEDAPFLADNSATAAILAEGVRRIGDVDVVVIGDSKQDPGVCTALAGHLGWTGLGGVNSVSFDEDRILAHRRADHREDTYAVPTPVVLGIAAVTDTDTTPGMKELLRARKAPVMKCTVHDLGLDITDIETSGTEVPEQKTTHTFQGSDAPSRLVSALRAEGVL